MSIFLALSLRKKNYCRVKKKCKSNFYQRFFENSKFKFSEGLEKLMHSLLNFDPDKRPTVEQVMKNEWVVETLGEMNRAERKGYFNIL